MKLIIFEIMSRRAREAVAVYTALNPISAHTFRFFFFSVRSFVHMVVVVAISPP